MMVLAAYDVVADARRSRLAALLQSVGDRVQKSVFVLSVDAETMSDIRNRAAGILDLDEDSLYFFRQCRTCWEAMDCVGQADPPTQELFWSVF